MVWDSDMPDDMARCLRRNIDTTTPRRRCRFRFLVSHGRIKFDIAVRFNNTRGILRLHLFEFEVIILVIVRNTNDISLCDTGKVSQGMFEYGTRIGNFEKIDMLGLQFNERGLWQTDVGNGENAAFFE